MNPIIATIAGFKNTLVIIGVLGKKIEPSVGDIHVGVCLVVVPVGVVVFGNYDVGCFTQSVL